jgi:8-oxo-dGTP diphosphatase
MSIDPSDRFKTVAAVHLILKKSDKFLLGKRQNTGWADGKFHLIGGHAEANELLSATVQREGLEELGIEFNATDMELVHVRSILRPDHSRLHVYFLIHSWKGEPSIKEPELCSELNWFSIDELPSSITNDSKEVLKNIQEKIYYSEIDQNE